MHRGSGVARFPARFQLIMAANPCPCGNFAGKSRSCTCSSSIRVAYLGKLSGPLLDRIDIRLKLQPPNLAQVALAGSETGLARSSSGEVRVRVQDARKLAQISDSNGR
ncbi:MAG: ATP-binding protein [Rhodoluna sp.]